MTNELIKQYDKQPSEKQRDAIRQVTQEIKNRTGLTGIKISKANGTCRFYSEDDISVDLSLTDSQYIERISMYTPEEWADVFEFELKQTGQWNPVKRGIVK